MPLSRSELSNAGIPAEQLSVGSLAFVGSGFWILDLTNCVRTGLPTIRNFPRITGICVWGILLIPGGLLLYQSSHVSKKAPDHRLLLLGKCGSPPILLWLGSPSVLSTRVSVSICLMVLSTGFSPYQACIPEQGSMSPWIRPA